MDVDAIQGWVNTNHMTLNARKCKFMLVSRKRNTAASPSITLDDTVLESVESFNYLGLVLTSNLSWDEHIESKCTQYAAPVWDPHLTPGKIVLHWKMYKRLHAEWPRKDGT